MSYAIIVSGALAALLLPFHSAVVTMGYSGLTVTSFDFSKANPMLASKNLSNFHAVSNGILVLAMEDQRDNVLNPEKIEARLFQLTTTPCKTFFMFQNFRGRTIHTIRQSEKCSTISICS
jgi:hypothetical protein